ncbi:acyltransferase [Arthrobacter sp. E918]|uniref:Acyltransferase n=1 Tax=Arthrobacter mobilis TaxID=2724944 RepID=A0A7X6K826_9MICC|nr:acyltransferase [Arthrobacter mobilis]
MVLHHSVILLGQMDLVWGPWAQLNRTLQVFRMPLFFAASGLFAASVLARPWKALWSSRLSLFVWIFLLWSVIRFLYFVAVPMEARPQETDLDRLLAAPLLPMSGLWFVHALFFFFVAAKLMRGRVDYRIQLVASAAMSVLFLSISSWNISWNGMGKYFFFFLAGCYLREFAFAWVRNRGSGQLVLAGVLFGAGVWALDFYELSRFGPAAFLLRVVAVAFGFLLAASAVSWRGGSVLKYLGRNTLPIYVVHVIIVAFLATLLSLAGHLPAGLRLILPLLVAAAAVCLALGLTRILRRPLLRFAYEAPEWFSGAAPAKIPATTAAHSG